MGSGMALAVTGMLIAFVLCVDHIADLMGWRLERDWVPLRGGFIDAARQLPRALYESVIYFPEASFAAFIFYPLAVIALAFYEAVQGYYAIILMGWLPFLAGVTIFLLSGLLIEKGDTRQGQDSL